VNKKMSCYIHGADGYFYKIAKKGVIRSVCVRAKDGEHSYNVHPTRYIISNGFLYKIANKNEHGSIKVVGYDNREYYVKIKPKRFKLNKDFAKIKNSRCSEPSPPPTVKFYGEGNADCDENTGICEVNAPKDAKFSVDALKGYKLMSDSNRFWLKKEDI